MTFRRKEPMRPEEALSRLQGLCAASEQCSQDLRKKLGNWGLSASQTNMVIRQLERDRFLDDARFACAYAHDKLMFNGWGRHKISRGLWSKGISSALIDEALLQLDEEEYLKKAYDVIRSKASGLERTRENATKLLRFGAGRGFEVSMLINIVKNAEVWEPR